MVICLPTYTKPHPVTVAAVEAAVPVLERAGWEHALVAEIGCPYISNARATMLRKAMNLNASHIVFLDHDVTFRPEDLLKLLETEGDVVAGTYRFKKSQVEYMGVIKTDATHRPLCRPDGCIRAELVPAGFLRLTKLAVQKFMRRYPELLYGDPDRYSVDLFNHGAIEGVWWGEDYAFSKRWNAIDHLWLIPDLQLDHHSADECFPGNFHDFLLACPGGSHAKEG